MQAIELANGLNNFYGSEQFFRHPMFYKKMVWTEGVNFFIQNAGNGAFWFLDIVGLEIWPLVTKKGEDFVVITLKSNGNSATITVTDGNENALFERGIDYTDCPEGEWRFFLVSGTFMLPTEY